MRIDQLKNLLDGHTLVDSENSRRIIWIENSFIHYRNENRATDKELQIVNFDESGLKNIGFWDTDWEIAL
jgi:hypothetical protein